MASLSGSNSIAWCRRFLKIPTQLLLLGSRKVGLLVLALASIFCKFCSLECNESSVRFGNEECIWWGREETLRKCSSCFLCFFGDPLCFGSWGTNSYDEVVRVSFLDDKLIVERKLRWNSKMLMVWSFLCSSRFMFRVGLVFSIGVDHSLFSLLNTDKKLKKP